MLQSDDISPVPNKEIITLFNSFCSGTIPSKIISRKSILGSSMQSAGDVVIRNSSRYSGVSYLSNVDHDKSHNSSSAICTREKSNSASVPSHTIRINIELYSDFAAPSADSSPSSHSFFSVTTSTSSGTSSTYSWNAEASTIASVSSWRRISIFSRSMVRSEI